MKIVDVQFTVNGVMVDNEEDENEVFENAIDMLSIDGYDSYYTQMDYSVNEDQTQQAEAERKSEREFEIRKDER